MESHDTNGDACRRVVIVGGGPAGMMAGLLMARAGVKVTVLEKHADFLRDFRGDTVHPSTLELFDQLGLLEELLELPHSRIDEISLRIGERDMKVVDFRALDVSAPFIAMMPQWDLLNFMAEKASRYPGFELRLGSEAIGKVSDPRGRICGVRLADGEVLNATLVIAADGRRSVLSQAAQLPRITLGAPMDVFWFRLDKPAEVEGDSFGALGKGGFLVLIDRRDYYQCALPFPKGRADSIRSAGLPAFRERIAELAPELTAATEALRHWDDVKLLEVALDRLICWHRPGLLAIGDAAHAMSPIGGVGINVAVQDSIAAANVLAASLARGEPVDDLLQMVQRNRWRAVTQMQAIQKIAQDRVIGPLLAREEPVTGPPLVVRALDRFPLLRRIPGRVIGLGFARQRIESPNAFPHIGS